MCVHTVLQRICMCVHTVLQRVPLVRQANTAASRASLGQVWCVCVRVLCTVCVLSFFLYAVRCVCMRSMCSCRMHVCCVFLHVCCVFLPVACCCLFSLCVFFAVFASEAVLFGATLSVACKSPMAALLSRLALPSSSVVHFLSFISCERQER